MKPIKKFQILSLRKSNHDGRYVGVLDMNDERTFDTEEEAIKYAFETNKYDHWIIVTHISFDYFGE